MQTLPVVNASLSLASQWECFLAQAQSFTYRLVLVKYLSCSERCGYIKMEMGYDDLMGTPAGLRVCQGFAILVVSS